MSPMRKKFYQGDRRDLPGRAPQKALWFEPGKFMPWQIHQDLGYNTLTQKEKEVYRALCNHSYLSKSSHNRRYIGCTHENLAEWSGCTKRSVVKAVKKILKARLAIRWHKGTTHSGASRYELPASLNQIIYWRINYKSQNKGGK